ncbi:adenylate kinase, partial [Colletotrichum plurivorum]
SSQHPDKVRTQHLSPWKPEPQASPQRRKFAVIFVLGSSAPILTSTTSRSPISTGAPGSGKGTICTHLARKHSLLHFSVGDALRAWMRANPEAPLASTIQDRLDHQGFLTSAELNPFLGLAIEEAARRDDDLRGILIDGFPRCEEQLDSWALWPFQERLPLEGSGKPDVVLLLDVKRENAEARYLARGRDRNDSAEKFTKRFSEYIKEGPPVERHYREAGLLIEIDNNGTKEENIATVEKALRKSALWNSAVVDQDIKSCFII